MFVVDICSAMGWHVNTFFDNNYKKLKKHTTQQRKTLITQKQSLKTD